MTGVRGRGLQLCVLRAFHAHAAVCRTAAAADIRDAYPLAGAGCRLSDGEYRIGHGIQHAYCPISNITQYRRISPNTQYPNTGIVRTLDSRNAQLRMQCAVITLQCLNAFTNDTQDVQIE